MKPVEQTEIDIAKENVISVSELLMSLPVDQKLSLDYIKMLNSIVEVAEALMDDLKGAVKEEVLARGKPAKTGGRRLVSNGLLLTIDKPRGQKIVTDWSALDEKFVKVEKKLNTQVVNEYVEQNGKLPVGVVEEAGGDGVVRFKKYVPPKPRKFEPKSSIENPLKDIKFKTLKK